MGTSKDRYIIYIDTGGTFSDTVILKSDGSFVVGKSPTTPEELEECFFKSIQAAADKMNISLQDVLSGTDFVGYGTTIGTNMLVTEKGGPKLGFITTKGLEDRTVIPRLRCAGLHPKDGMHIVAADGPRPLIPRKFIYGVAERVDSQGEEVIPLNEKDVEAAVRALLDEGVEGIAVGFLWSFLYHGHERRVGEIIKDMAPDLPVSLSSEVAPILREYPRFMSTIIDLYIGRALRDLLKRIEGQLKEYGYMRPLLIMQAIGGVAVSKSVKPATTLHSGPVAGLVGVEFYKKLYGYKNAIGTDVGGTSFDITMSLEKGEEYLREPIAGRYALANPMRELNIIGAGGGTIAHIDPITGGLLVGPESAGAAPGPICYGRGGTEPTVTDADLVMNRLDPDYFLGGKLDLDMKDAEAAIKEKIAGPLKMTVIEASEAICRIIDAKMEATLNTIMAVKGVDPKETVALAFGGAGASHCAGYTKNIGFPKVIIPRHAAVFCAFGASTADIKHRYEASPFILIADIPWDIVTLRFDVHKMNSLEEIPSWVPDRFNRMFEELEQKALKDMKIEGFMWEEVSRSYEFLGRYGGQLWEIRCISPVSRIRDIKDLRVLIQAFEEEYRDLFSKEAMSPRGGLEIISIALVVEAPTQKPIFVKSDFVGEVPSQALKGRRDVCFNSAMVRTNIYDLDLLQVGNVVEGPAVIEGTETNIVVPEDRKVTTDEYLNFVMEYR